MKTITIRVDNGTKQGERFLDFLETLNFVTIVPKKRTTGIDKALEDVEKGRVYTAKNTKDLMEKTTR